MIGLVASYYLQPGQSRVLQFPWPKRHIFQKSGHPAFNCNLNLLSNLSEPGSVAYNSWLKKDTFIMQVRKSEHKSVLK